MVKKRFSRGMTLTEILIVLGVVIFLTVLIISALRNQILKGRDARRKGEIHKIQVAIEEYEKDHDCYPLPQTVVCKPGTGLQPYLAQIPCDPTTKASYFYDYEDSACPHWYRIFVLLENKKDKDILGYIGPNGAYNYYLGSPNAPAPGIVSTPTGSATPGGTSPPEGTPAPSDFYGCKSGVCVPISWDPARPGPECDPNYQSSVCYGQCGLPGTECLPWK